MAIKFGQLQKILKQMCRVWRHLKWKSRAVSGDERHTCMLHSHRTYKTTAGAADQQDENHTPTAHLVYTLCTCLHQIENKWTGSIDTFTLGGGKSLNYHNSSDLLVYRFLLLSNTQMNFIKYKNKWIKLREKLFWDVTMTEMPWAYIKNSTPTRTGGPAL